MLCHHDHVSLVRIQSATTVFSREILCFYNLALGHTFVVWPFGHHLCELSCQDIYSQDCSLRLGGRKNNYLTQIQQKLEKHQLGKCDLLGLCCCFLCVKIQLRCETCNFHFPDSPYQISLSLSTSRTALTQKLFNILTDNFFLMMLMT